MMKIIGLPGDFFRFDTIGFEIGPVAGQLDEGHTLRTAEQHQTSIQVRFNPLHVKHWWISEWYFLNETKSYQKPSLVLKWRRFFNQV